ncbi:MAG: tRNA (cytidine(34)-2'-O)-methyltransferase [Coriobacteriales bacterium]|jgi:tRNA (cytidine/uridine-2'-O-)-methyltransferase
MPLNVVLYQPEIPANTGTIGRSCVLTGARLHLIGPLGFSLDDRMIRRSGMGYWHDIDLHVYEDFGEFRRENPGVRPWLCTKKAHRCYHEVVYGPDDFIMFGKESTGIDEAILAADPERCLRIPMLEREGLSPATTPGPVGDPTDPDAVSLNLSNAANIVMFEALRQLGFPGMEHDGPVPKV